MWIGWRKGWRRRVERRADDELSAEHGRLIGSLPGQSLKLAFVPASPTHYYALERPFELRFDGKDRQKLTLVTWGIETAAGRVTPSH